MAVNTSIDKTVVREDNTVQSVLYGVVAGVIGGVVFGMLMMMVMPNILPTIGKIIGIENLAGGWLYHIFNSAVIGGVFGLVFGRLSTTYSYATGAVWGAAYGFIWWILGSLILMPQFLGMTEMMFVINTDSIMAAMGHIMFGLVTGLSYILIRDRLRA